VDREGQTTVKPSISAGSGGNGGVRSPIQSYIERLHARHASNGGGEVANYIPELTKADPGWFGICVATVDGRVYEVGDSRQPFTIQSISKPLTYGLALEDRGRAAVLSKIGVEPTGDAFNSISLAPETGCPLNPMINAGAIAAASLVAGHSLEDRYERVRSVYSTYAGRPLELDRAVFESERDTGHRNRAIGHMLRNFGILTDDPGPALDLYFRQCSILVDCRDLSLMAATLANDGVHPVTGERAVRSEFVASILSVMATCGMYDYAGAWVYGVGLPAKSGVGGGILAVLPGQLGIGVFSPRLDPRGNSVRGVAVCTDLSRDFNLHFLRVPRSSQSAVRARHDLSTLSSKRMRSVAERKWLDENGRRVRVIELHGDLAFPSIEALVRQIVDSSVDTDVAIVDLKRTTRIEASTVPLLVQLIVEFGEHGKQLVLSGPQAHPRFLRSLEEQLTAADQWGRLRTFPDLEPALEWAENSLLAKTSGVVLPDNVSLGEHSICSGLSVEELRILEGMVERRQFAPREFILRNGEPADAMYLLTRGRVSVTIELPDGQRKRLSTVSPGMAFGELAVLERGPRTADVRADIEVECFALSVERFEALGVSHPHIKMTILENLLRNLSQVMRRLNRELLALAS